MSEANPPASSYDAAQISNWFDESGMKEWNRLVATPVDEVSLHIHQHYLEQYIQPGMRILEIGAGAGRFTQALAGLGARVLVADISAGQLELNRQLAARFGFAAAVEDWVQVDICDLQAFQPAQFDAVVAYGGPFSYVLDRRSQALNECGRVLRPGGPLLFSVMSLWGTAHRALNGVLGLPPEVNQNITASGDLTAATFPGRQGNFMHMFRASELRAWLQAAGWEILAMSASGVLAAGWEAVLEPIRADPPRWQELLRCEVEASAELESLNLGTHLIAVARRA